MFIERGDEHEIRNTGRRLLRTLNRFAKGAEWRLVLFGKMASVLSRLIPFWAAIPVVVLPHVAFAELNGLFNESLFRISPSALWAVDALFFVVFPILGIWFLARFAGIRPAHYGLAFPPPLRGELAMSSLFLAALLCVAYYLPQKVIGGLLTTGPAFSYAQAIPSGWLRGPSVLYLAVTAGVTESVVYVSLPWLVWERLFGPGKKRALFAWLSSAIFASVHWESGFHNVVAALIFGLVACGLYLKLRDLWPIVGAHIAVDLVGFW
jgi:membrane protease YdiL (CAAX protease family)